jgi:acyl carrier protein
MQTDLNRTIKAFVATNFLKDREANWGDDDSFIEEGVIDSTGALELVAFLELTFDIRVEDEEINPANLDSINRLIHYVMSKLDSG